MKQYSDITLRYIKVQRKRALLTVLGIVLSVALITSIGTMLMSMRDRLMRDEIKNNGDYHAVFLQVEGEKVSKLRNNVEVGNSALTVREGTGLLSQIDGEERKNNPESPFGRYLTVRSYDADAFKMFPVTLKEGRFPQNEKEIIVDYWVPDYLPQKPKVGDRISLDLGVRKSSSSGHILEDNSWSSDEVFEKKSTSEFTIVGLINPSFAWPSSYFSNGITFLDNRELAKDKKYNVFVKLNSVRDVYNRTKQIAADAGLTAIKGESGAVSFNIQYHDRLLRLSAQSMNRGMNKGLILTVAFIVILIIICTAAVIYNAFHISVLERISQFGILRCVGASPGQIRRTVLKEAGILSIIGIPLGLFCGVFAMKIVMHFITILKFDLLEDLKITVYPVVFIVSTLLGLFTVYLSAYGPARQAARVSPLEAVRNTGGFKKENFKKVKNSIFARAIFGTEGQIASKNLRRNKKRFRITVFSMIISIVLYIVFGSFVDFMFKMGVVDPKEEGDFAVWASGRDKGITQDIYRDLRNINGVEAVFKSFTMSHTVAVPENKINPEYIKLRIQYLSHEKGEEIELHNSEIKSYGDENLQEFTKYLKEGRIDKAAMDKGNGVLVVKTGMLYDESRRKNVKLDIVDYKLGDEIKIKVWKRSVEGKESKEDIRTVKVMGILERGVLGDDYNVNGGINIIATESVYEYVTGSDIFYRAVIKLENAEARDTVTAYLKQLRDKDSRYHYVDYHERAKEDRNAAIAISIFLYGFIAVIVLIGCLNIVNTISTNIILRTRELSVLKAVGMARGGIKKLICLEGIFYGTIAAFYGGIIGTALSYVLFKLMLNIREFEWAVPWNQIVIAVFGATLMALLSGYLPLRKINSGVIIDNIRMEE
jgi:putative ABC transport system permease protein